MKKNWILFFVICGTAYAWLFYVQYQKQQEYEKNYALYEAQLAEYEDKQAEKEQEKAEATKLREELKKQLAQQGETADGEVPAEAVQTEADAEVPTISAEQRDLLKRLLTIDDPDVARHVIDTPLYRVEFTELGARPIHWEIKSSEFVTNVSELGNDEDTSVYLIPQVGSINERSYPFSFSGDTARDFNNTIFSGTRTELDGATRLVFRSDPEHGLVAVKDFLFHHDSYVVDLTVTFENGPETGKNLGRKQGFGIGWQGGFGEPHAADRVHGYGENAVIATDDDIRARRIDREDEDDLFEGETIEWAGQEKKFFAAMIIPNPENPVKRVRTHFDAKDDADEYKVKGTNIPLSVEMFHESQRIEPNETISLQYQAYVGPKNREALLSKDFLDWELAVEPAELVFHQIPLGLGFLRGLCLMLLALMRSLHDWIGVWGVAIIGTTIVVRVLIYPLTHWAIKNQARTMIEQQKIRPEMEAINKKYKSDPMKRNQAVMQLYRDHNVNPLGMFRGCFPMLLQTPVFLALYVVFEQSVELRGQTFLWIPDLSGPDRLFTWNSFLPLIGDSFNLLPILMGATNYLQMSIMRMPATDEMQEKIQKQMTIMMPIMFIFFLYRLPSGLILYWIVSNCISILQSFLTKRIIASHMAAHEAEKAAKGAGDSSDKEKIRERALT